MSFLNKKLVVGITSSSTIIVIILVLFLFTPSETVLNEIEFSEQENKNNPIVAEINDKKIRRVKIKREKKTKRKKIK